MGSNTSKQEEIVIAQTASGGTNQAVPKISDISRNISTTDIILSVFLIMTLMVFMYGVYKLYIRCHTNLVRRELDYRATLRRSFGLGRRGIDLGQPRVEPEREM